MQDPINISSPNGDPPKQGGLNVQDILSALFRHKWLIVICTVLGIAGAGVTYFVVPPAYVSEAELLIRYVVEAKPIDPTKAADTTVRSPDSRGENIMNTQVSILTSLDLAAQVADQGLAEKLLAGSGGGTDTNAAGGVIRRGLTVRVPGKSDVIQILFRHSDPTVVQPVINRLVDTYIKRHAAIHQGIGVMDTTYQTKRDDFKNRMLDAEGRLNQMRTNYGVISIEDAKRSYGEQISKLTIEITGIEAELAETEVLTGTLRNTPVSSTNAAATVEGATPPGKEPGTSAPPASTNETAFAAIPKDKLTLYANVLRQLDDLAKQETQILARYQPSHPSVVHWSNEVAVASNRRVALEQEYPAIASAILPVPTAPGDASGASTPAALDPIRVPALQARLTTMRAALTNLQAKAALLVNVEPEVIRLQRERDLAETGFRYYAAAAEQVNLTTGHEGVRNIGVIQNATPPMKDTKRLMKMCGAICGGGCGLGVGLALLLDLVLRRSIRRGDEVERRLHMPLFMDAPDHARSSRGGRPRGNSPATVSPKVAANGDSGALATASTEPLPWEHGHALHPYCEALRDRLITHFDLNKLTHKPKLVALTSCRQGAGVSTLAMGVAASFSETGDGNVLLVDMSGEQGAAHPFSHGKPCTGLSEVLKPEDRTTARVNENLYLATVHEPNLNHDELPRALPRRFAKIVPKLKASDYDYIIFDMPPVGQTTITARLARYMDIVMLVLEADKTPPERALKAKAILAESGTTSLAAVLNKSRNYLPAALANDL